MNRLQAALPQHLELVGCGSKIRDELEISPALGFAEIVPEWPRVFRPGFCCVDGSL